MPYDKVEVDRDKLTSLEQVKAIFGEDWPGFFNNFSSWFPALHKGSVADRRGTVKGMKKLDLLFSSFTHPERHKYYSQKYLGQTPRDFFEIIDRLTEELSISPDEIRKLEELKLEANSRELEILYHKQLLELIAPVFFRLREMGYGHFDLTG